MLARVMIGAMVVLGFGRVVFAGCTCTACLVANADGVGVQGRSSS